MDLNTTSPLDYVIAYAPGTLTAVERLERLHELAQTVRGLIEEDVRAARSEGASWAAVGDALDMSRQAAHERFAI